MAGTDRPTVAAYYFPNYHVDPLNEAAHGKGWTEWQLVRAAQPRFAGQQQPKVPAWGYEDEADPAVFARKVDAAADNGIDVMLFDWYYYAEGMFLERCLNDGYLKAPNRGRLKFALMWANHDWYDLHPAKWSGNKLLYSAAVTPESFRTMCDRVIRDYFPHENYWRLDGKPYFSIFRPSELIRTMGGIEAARDALQWFRNRGKEAGFGGVHINVMANVDFGLFAQGELGSVGEVLKVLGVDSATHYNWLDLAGLESFPSNTYESFMRNGTGRWEEMDRTLPCPYLPNVTTGWDTTPRLCGTDIYAKADFPWVGTVVGNTPALLEQGLRKAKDFLAGESTSKHKVVTINAFNEWTEGCYLEPDAETGMARLEAIRNVFGVCK